MVDSIKEQLLNRGLYISNLETLNLKSYDKFVLQIIISFEEYEQETGTRMTSKKYLEYCSNNIKCGNVNGDL